MITFDFETKSYADLPKTGAWAYSEHPTTAVICCAWGIDQEEIQTWWPGKELVGVQCWDGVDYVGEVVVQQMPADLCSAIQKGHIVECHNVSFERSCWENIMMPRYGWVLPADDQWRDTMAVAQYYALPASLDGVSRVLGYGPKDSRGGRLISKYSKLHLKTAQVHIPDHEWVAWKDMSSTERRTKGNERAKEAGGYYQEDFQEFVKYCIDDVKREQSVGDTLGDLPDRELPVFLMDQRINRRGLYLDIEGIEAATKIVNKRSEDLIAEFVKLTGLKPTQREKVMTWFHDQGLALENLQADYLEALAEDGEIPAGDARRALAIRLAINKASVKKLAAMALQRGMDGRARFQTRYHGAATGRWTGNGFQPLNLVRNDEDIDPDQLVRDIMYEDASWLDTLYDDALDAVSKASRHWIMAAPGNRILSGDWVSVEAVILACLAGEQWKIDAFRQGVKIYEFMADQIHGLPPGTVTKDTHPLERKDGKTGELACGYQGALGAWLKFDNSGRHSDEAILGFVRAWRTKHPQTTSFWNLMGSTAIRATRSGKLEQVGDTLIAFEVVDEWLTMVLPSEKRLWYRSPKVSLRKPRWCRPEELKECRTGLCGHKPELVLSYWASKNKQWARTYTYGGKLTENACQAVSREILVPAMMRAEAAGYEIILSVYDEIVSEVPKDFGSLEEFKDLMRGPLPDWAAGWPINVDGWEGKRYRK